jgi:endonuclease/exonuclease/phosphatase family metal-dependent hydrolase
MIGRIEARLRRLRRAFSRKEWAVRILRASRSTDARAERGLILVQIDGLGKSQLERAIADGRMPYLARLLRREQHVLHPMYSGVPSTTGAAQGELFFGVTTAVPAFGFWHHDLGRPVRLVEPEIAARIEGDLAAKTRGLLEGGSAFSDLLAGGAMETRLCAATFGRREPKPFAFLLVLAMHAGALVRIAGLVLAEAALAVRDSILGILAGQDLMRELRFVLTRVAVNAALKEVCIVGASIDAVRGLPIVHVNLVGYDEQSHRRGPFSAFAHRCLPGIDRAIRRVAGAARRSAYRDYDLWVYSDHGQEEVVPFEREHGKSIAEVVAATEPGGDALPAGAEPARVVADGPLGFVHVERDLSPERFEEWARRLVAEGVPIVLRAAPSGTARAWTEAGSHELPKDAASVLGRDHPYPAAAATDLASVCHHADAGPLVLSGWRSGERPVSFAPENGAHGGPGSHEVGAFAIVPRDAPVAPPPGRDYIRLADLRHGALALRGRAERAPRPRSVPRAEPAESRTVRVMTYNVHSCLGMDGRVSTSRIARVIARSRPDVVALQELDVGRKRTGGVDQARAIADDLEMELHFHAALSVGDERYGNAVLSRFPIRLVRADGLPPLALRRRLEPRGALWVAIDVGGLELTFVTTHLGLSRRERLHHAEVLLGPEWLAHPDCRRPIVLCGDLNDGSRSPSWRRFHGVLRDAQLADGGRPRNTWTSRVPIARLDHVFVGRGIDVLSVEVPRTELARTASDHLPLVVDLNMPYFAAGDTVG